MTLNRHLHALATVLVFLGIIWAAQLGGVWTTSGKVTATGERITATGADVAEVRGWMTVGEVTEAYGVPVEELYAAFGIPADTPTTTALKELEPVAPAFSVTALRDWLRARPGTG
jgi:hypothetical protein